MSGVSGLLGMGGGASGSGFAAPTGVNQGQLDTSYNQTQSGIQQQQAFLQALQGQNGLGNQNSVFQQQQALSNQLQGVANGTGPNPAQAQLAQATGANTANQAALMAGQRGASQNVGLIARQAAQQGAANQQNAVGQGATLQAQQSLAAMQQLQNQQASMGNLANTQVNQQQAGLQALNNASLQQQSNLYGLQGNINNANANLATASQSAQTNVLGGLAGGVGSAVGLVGGGSGASGGAGAGGGGIAMAGGDAADDLSTLAVAEGGKIPHYAGGGITSDPLVQSIPVQEVTTAAMPDGPSSNVGKFMSIPEMPLNKPKEPDKDKDSPANGLSKFGGQAIQGISNLIGGKSGTAAGEIGQNIGNFFGAGASDVGDLAGGAGDAISGAGAEIGSGTAGGIAEGVGEGAVAVAAKGGKVPALLSPGERYLSPDKAKAAAKGQVDPIKAGKLVPGKPKVKGAKNDYANDTVKASLDEGGLVLPRSVTQAKNPHWEAMRFVQAHMAKGGLVPRKAKKK